jgi:hypothetical protein
VRLVTSGCHHGLPSRAAGRDRRGAARRLLAAVPGALRAQPGHQGAKSAQPWVATLVRTIFEQPDATSVRAQHAQDVTALEAKFPQAAAHLDEARDDILAFTAFPHEIWRQIWSNNPKERLNKEIRRRTDMAASSPTATPSCALSARFSPSRTTKGLRRAAIWVPKFSPPARKRETPQKLVGMT